MRRFFPALAALAACMLLTATAHAGRFGTPRSFGGVVSKPVTHGDVAYFPNGASLAIEDLTDPAHPVASRVDLLEPLEGRILSSTVAGDALAVIAATSSGSTLSLFSLADPTHPVLASTILSDVSAIVGEGSLLYVVSQNGAVFAYDVSDPAHPQGVVSMSGTSYGSLDVRAAAGRIYSVVAETPLLDLFLTIYDVHDPAHPIVAADAVDIDQGNALGDPTDDGFLPVSRPDGWSMLDTHAAPAIADVFDDRSGDIFFDGARSGTTLYLGNIGAVATWDITDPAAPRHVDDVAVPNFADAHDLALLDDGLLVVTDQNAGYLYDRSGAALTGPVSAIATPYEVGQRPVTRDDAHIYLSMGGKFQVLDATTFETVGFVDPSIAGAEALVQSGRYVVIGTTVFVIGIGVTAVDVSDPASPRIVGSVLADEFLYGTADTDRVYAYSPDTGSLVVVDISDPTAMRVGGSIRGDYSGYYATYAARGTTGFVVSPTVAGIGAPLAVHAIYSGNVTQPRDIGSFPVCADSVEVSALAENDDGTALAVACDNGNIEFYDVRNPAAALLLSTIATSINGGIAWRGDAFYVGAHIGSTGDGDFGDGTGIDVYNVMQPSQPGLMAHVDIPDFVARIALAPDGSLIASTESIGIVADDCFVLSHDIECGFQEAVAARGHSRHARREP